MTDTWRSASDIRREANYWAAVTLRKALEDRETIPVTYSAEDWARIVRQIGVVADRLERLSR